MVGFNRRFAPAYAALQERPRDIILMQKNRASFPGPARDMIFDDFVHVVDTLLSLVPGPVLQTSHEVRLVDGLLHHIVLHLSGVGFAAIGVMNRMSGSDEESLEVMGGGEKWRVENLARTIRYAAGTEEVTRAGDWRPATWVRGIEQTCDAFLRLVQTGGTIPPDASLPTHAICEAITADAERQGG